MKSPRFAVIRDHIRQRIDTGEWAPQDQVPSENELAAQFGVSRMTARRALHELAEAGLLTRTQGRGSFVSDKRPLSSMLEIRNIAQDIVERGHRYSAEVVCLGQLECSQPEATLLNVEPGSPVYHSQIVHKENDTPVQMEERFVNIAFAPGYVEQNFCSQTPNAYLSQVAPITEADHVIEACIASCAVVKAMGSTPGQPFLKITRRTWSHQGIVSLAYLLHPGDRYRLGSHLHFGRD